MAATDIVHRDKADGGTPLKMVIGATDTVIGEDAESKEAKQIDLSALNPTVPVAQALVGRHATIGEVIPIARGDELLWKFVFAGIKPDIT